MTAAETQLLMDIAAYLRTLTPGATNQSLLKRIDAALGDIPASSRIAVEVPVRI